MLLVSFIDLTGNYRAFNRSIYLGMPFQDSGMSKIKYSYDLSFFGDRDDHESCTVVDHLILQGVTYRLQSRTVEGRTGRINVHNNNNNMKSEMGTGSDLVF